MRNIYVSRNDLYETSRIIREHTKAAVCVCGGIYPGMVEIELEILKGYNYVYNHEQAYITAQRSRENHSSNNRVGGREKTYMARLLSNLIFLSTL